MRKIPYVCFILFFLIRCAEDSLEIPKIDRAVLIRNDTHVSDIFYENTPDTLGFQLTARDLDGDIETLYVDTYQGDYLTGTIIDQNTFSITAGKSISYSSNPAFITTSTLGNYCLKFVIGDKEGNESLPYVVSYSVTYEPFISSSVLNINFGSVPIRTESAPVTVTISNIGALGEANLEMSILSFTGDDSASGYQGWGFTAAKIGTDQSYPVIDGTVYTCTVIVDGDNENPQSVSIIGNDAPTLNDVCSEIQSDLDGAICYFDEDHDQIIIQSNTIGDSSKISITDPATNGLFKSLSNANIDPEDYVNGVDHQFNKSSDNVSLNTISPAGSETVDITFAPIKTGTFNAVLVIPYNHVYLSPLQITLTGVGVP